jgi:hypothetical protein
MFGWSIGEIDEKNIVRNATPMVLKTSCCFLHFKVAFNVLHRYFKKVASLFINGATLLPKSI